MEIPPIERDGLHPQLETLTQEIMMLRVGHMQLYGDYCELHDAYIELIDACMKPD